MKTIKESLLCGECAHCDDALKYFAETGEDRGARDRLHLPQVASRVQVANSKRAKYEADY